MCDGSIFNRNRAIYGCGFDSVLFSLVPEAAKKRFITREDLERELATALEGFSPHPDDVNGRVPVLLEVLGNRRIFSGSNLFYFCVSDAHQFFL
jgi:hypothetical protein